MSDKPRKNRARLLVTLCLLGTLVGCIGLYWYLAELDPVVNIPQSPPTPQPNAFDYYMQTANGLAGVGPDIKPVWAIAAPEDRGTLAEQMAVLEATEHYLAPLREGFGYAYQAPSRLSFQAVFPEFARFRDVARYLRFAGEMKAAQGDWQGAMRCYLDAVEMGQDIPNHAPLIGMLVGVAVQSIGRQDSWEAVPHLTAAQAKAAVTRMQGIIAQEYPYADTMREEKTCTQASILELFQKKGWRGDLLTGGPGGANVLNGAIPLPSSNGQNHIYIIMSKRQIMKRITAGWDANIARAQQPFAQQANVDPPTGGDLISQTFMPVFAKARWKYAVNGLTNNLLLVSLALQAYKAEHQAYPATLKALVPNYLPAIPQDTFAQRGELRYKRTGDTYVLYSVGPDGDDDGGKPCENAGPEARRFLVQSGSRGDMVAGIN